MIPLFVYGTLLEGQANAGVLGPLRRHRARTRGRLWRLPAGYPALEPIDDAWVEGELLHLPEARLRVVDLLEGVQEGLYRRDVRPVEARGIPGVVPAHVYLMDTAQLRARQAVRLPVNDWRALSPGVDRARS